MPTSQTPHWAVYPRVCGGNPGVRAGYPPGGGLSPRVRGKRYKYRRNLISARSIPACAGETRSSMASTSACKVYPRVCGGNESTHSSTSAGLGLSPRVRGKRVLFAVPAVYRRSIPACAGETSSVSALSAAARVYPRVCGGNLWRTAGRRPPLCLSPRVQGKRPAACRPSASLRSIPACAGETHYSPLGGNTIRVYPRVCGGNIAATTPDRPRVGLSPRVRGKPGDPVV